MAPLRWVLLSSRLPREPSRLRLAVWRRLRRLGALLLHDAVWVLPADAKTREAFEWLAEEIGEQGGTVFLWEAESLDEPQNEDLVARFRAEADARYATLTASAGRVVRAATRLKRRAGSASGTAVRQLKGIDRAVRLERRRDYFGATGRTEAEAAVASAMATLIGSAPGLRREENDDALDHPAASTH